MQQKKKALFVTTVGNFLRLFEWNDVTILQKMNYEVHYAADFTQLNMETDKLYQKGKIILHSLPICRSPLKVKNLQALFKLRKLIREEGYELLHCHTPMGGVLGRLAAMGQKKKPLVLYTAHGFHFYKGAPFYYWLLYFPMEYLLARETDRLITVNTEDYQRAIHFPLRKEGKVERIPGVGLSPEKLVCRTEYREELRETYGIPKECFYILTAGELNRNKNQQVLLQMLALLKEKQIHLGICGEGPCREHLEQLAWELGISEQVSFLGYRNDLQELLTAADAFAFPSFREGFAIAPLEAMAAGLPLITSERRDSREYVRHGKNGLVCRKNTPEEYAEAVLQLLEQPEFRKRLSAEGKKTAGQYAQTETARIMKRVYEECQNRRDKSHRRDRPHEEKRETGNQCHHECV